MDREVVVCVILDARAAIRNEMQQLGEIEHCRRKCLALSCGLDSLLIFFIGVLYESPVEDRGERQFTFASPTERSSYHLDDDRITRMIVGPHDITLYVRGLR